MKNHNKKLIGIAVLAFAFAVTAIAIADYEQLSDMLIKDSVIDYATIYDSQLTGNFIKNVSWVNETNYINTTNDYSQIVYDNYTIQLGILGATSPSDNTYYYFGQTTSLVATAHTTAIEIPINSQIREIYGHFAETAGTGEYSNLSLFVNGNNVNTLSTTIYHNQSILQFNFTGINQNVNAGDWIELRWGTPTWATNPTVQRVFATVLLNTTG